MCKFTNFFTPFYLILSLSFHSLSLFSRPQPAEPGSTLGTLESGCGEDFAFASQQASIVVFFCLLPALNQFEFQVAGAAMYAPLFSPVFQPHYAGFKLGFIYLFFFLNFIFVCSNLTRNARPSLYKRSLRLPPRMRASLTAGASAIPSGHSCSSISRHRWPSGADTVCDNFGRAITSDTSGAECCRLSGGRPPSTGSGHSQSPRSSGSSGAGVAGPVLGVVGPVLGVGWAHCSGLPRVLGSSGLTRGPLSSQIRGSSSAAVSSAGPWLMPLPQPFGHERTGTVDHVGRRAVAAADRIVAGVVAAVVVARISAWVVVLASTAVIPHIVATRRRCRS